MRQSRWWRGCLLLIGLWFLAGCGLGSDPLNESESDDRAAPEGPVRIGWVSEEQELIAEAYAGRLRAEGLEADITGFGSRQELLDALTGDELDVAPEYSGELLTHIDQDNPATGNVDEGVAALPGVLEPDLGILESAGAGSRMVYVIPPAVTEQYDLTSLEDAGGYLDGKQLGGPADLANAPYGPSGLAGIYGFTVTLVPQPDADALIEQLNSGEVAVAVLRSTDPRIDLVVSLDDPQRVVPDNAIVPLIRTELSDTPVAERINEVQAALGEDGLLELTADVDGAAPEVAQAWLEARDLG